VNDVVSKQGLIIKRLFDLVIGLAVLVISLPLMILISIFIKIGSRGSAIFKQKRLGKDLKVFKCFKFRTMSGDAEKELKCLLAESFDLRREWNANFKLKKDPRITRLGTFLRKTSLDELPQLFNVIRGEMSLVGPRPRPLYELKNVGDTNTSVFNMGLSVKPGITGLWQISGRSKIEFQQRIELDALYAKEWSLGLDIKILIKTVYIVIRQKGAC